MSAYSLKVERSSIYMCRHIGLEDSVTFDTIKTTITGITSILATLTAQVGVLSAEVTALETPPTIQAVVLPKGKVRKFRVIPEGLKPDIIALAKQGYSCKAISKFLNGKLKPILREVGDSSIRNCCKAVSVKWGTKKRVPTDTVIAFPVVPQQQLAFAASAGSQ